MIKKDLQLANRGRHRTLPLAPKILNSPLVKTMVLNHRFVWYLLPAVFHLEASKKLLMRRNEKSYHYRSCECGFQNFGLLNQILNPKTTKRVNGPIRNFSF